MKSLCKNTQRVLMAFDGDVHRLLKQHPEMANHLKKCPVCRSEAGRIRRQSVLLRGQRLQIEDKAFWADFERGLYRKLQNPQKGSFFRRIQLALSRIVRGFLFQPAYRFGLAVAVLFLVSYWGYSSFTAHKAAVIDPYDYLYESYQEASDRNPVFQSFSDPADELIEFADMSGEGR
ncbi:MAG: hypothetical protein GXO76_04375 [Calditrichaeota bacterium]|nr:hypothetical protein [Calditrichota bacterium]